MKMLWILVAAFLCILATNFPVLAGDFDGSKPLLFAVVETVECVPDGECLHGSAESIGIPQFFRIDFKNQLISSTLADGTLRTTKILNKTSTDDNISLQGIQNEKAWSMIIDKNKGKVVLAVSDAASGFIVFGACTPY